jgi:hypothetical protein
MAGTHNAGGVMHIQPDVAFRRELWLTRMQTNANPDGDALGPAMAGQGALDGHGCRGRISGTGKSHEEGIALRVDFVALPLPKCRP